MLMGRSSPEQSKTMQILTERHARFTHYICDFAERASVDRATNEILNSKSIPAAVIHNAGTIDRALLVETTDEMWDQQLEVNLSSPFRITRALLPRMLFRKSGRIVFVSSISAVLGSREQAPYHAAKAGMLGAMRCLAEELTNTGVTTMALLPGSVETRMLRGSGFPPRMQPEDVAKTLAFYALDAPSGHNGASVEMFGV